MTVRLSERDKGLHARARARERAIMDELERRARTRSPTPTNGELGDALGGVAKSSIAKILTRLERVGAIRLWREDPAWPGVRGRAIEISGEASPARGIVLGFRLESDTGGGARRSAAAAARARAALAREDAVFGIIEAAARLGLPAPASTTIAQAAGLDDRGLADDTVQRLKRQGRIRVERAGRLRIFILPDGNRTAAGSRNAARGEPGAVDLAGGDLAGGDLGGGEFGGRAGSARRPATCQWFVRGYDRTGTPAAIDAAKCGRPVAPGRPYCPDHCARAVDRSGSALGSAGRGEIAGEGAGVAA